MVNDPDVIQRFTYGHPGRAARCIAVTRKIYRCGLISLFIAAYTFSGCVTAQLCGIDKGTSIQTRLVDRTNEKLNYMQSLKMCS